MALIKDPRTGRVIHVAGADPQPVRWTAPPMSSGAPPAPNTASFVTATAEASLPNERVLTAGAGVTIIDNGPNSTIVVSATGTSPGDRKSVV